jgi:hypothetical protein
MTQPTAWNLPLDDAEYSEACHLVAHTSGCIACALSACWVRAAAVITCRAKWRRKQRAGHFALVEELGCQSRALEQQLVLPQHAFCECNEAGSAHRAGLLYMILPISRKLVWVDVVLSQMETYWSSLLTLSVTAAQVGISRGVKQQSACLYAQ